MRLRWMGRSECMQTLKLLQRNVPTGGSLNLSLNLNFFLHAGNNENQLICVFVGR